MKQVVTITAEKVKKMKLSELVKGIVINESADMDESGILGGNGKKSLELMYEELDRRETDYKLYESHLESKYH